MDSFLPCCSPGLLPAQLRPALTSAALVTLRHASRRRTALRPRRLYSPSSVRLTASWFPADDDGYGGWYFSEPKPQKGQNNKGQLKLVLAGVGTSMALLVAAFVISKKDLKFQINSPFHAFQELMASEYRKFFVREKQPTAIETDHVSETNVDDKLGNASDHVSETNVDDKPVMRENKHIALPLAADSSQLEAVHVLKKLKIIENDVNAAELCTRREYARWLVKANSMLERNLKHRMVPSVLIGGSMVAAFDDVGVDDPDYWCIQSLGEAGIVPSKLSMNSSNLSVVLSSEGQTRCDFQPESFISRFDMANWRTMLEYPFDSEIGEKISRTTVGFLDFNAFGLEASPQLLIDLMADEKSISRRVFGNTRRLEPHKPATKAQAAVSLTSGRMAEAILTELSKLELENQARLLEIEEIRSDLISRGDIQRFWEERMIKVRDHGFEVERDLHAAFVNLEMEKLARDEGHANYLKEKAALECQQQLLRRLREEVDEMCVKLANEKASYMVDQQNMEKLLIELHEKQDAIFQTKSVLEAEKEALRILRTWVEEEALRTQARTKILEGAVQRWNWSEEFGIPQTTLPESGNSHIPGEIDDN